MGQKGGPKRAIFGHKKFSSLFFSKVPERHHPRGTTLREALRGNLPLRGLCGGLSEGSAGSPRGFCGVSPRFWGGPRDFPWFFGGGDPMLVTLGNCWIWGAGGGKAIRATRAIRVENLPTPNPEGPERHLDAPRQKLPRDNFCRSIAAQLPSPRGQF